jgi:hypothetical protein
LSPLLQRSLANPTSAPKPFTFFYDNCLFGPLVASSQPASRYYSKCRVVREGFLTSNINNSSLLYMCVMRQQQGRVSCVRCPDQRRYAHH